MATSSIVKTRPPVSATTKHVIVVGALVFPFVPIAAGAVIAHSYGAPALNGALAGCIATFLIVGLAWIVLGVLSARHEVRSGSNAGPPEPP